eukprot:3346857-Amphidinium_carterae.1
MLGGSQVYRACMLHPPPCKIFQDSASLWLQVLAGSPQLTLLLSAMRSAHFTAHRVVLQSSVGEDREYVRGVALTIGSVLIEGWVSKALVVTHRKAVST